MSVRDAFSAFMDADDALSSTEAFQALRTSAGVAEKAPLGELAARCVDALPFKFQKLFKVLKEAQERARRDVPERKPTRIVVSGAGPCGLRAAVEARLLGHDVLVLERRTTFSRHNIIKTSKHTVADLMALGLQIFNPSFMPHGLLHVGTREIQLVLLKALLLLGGVVRYDTMMLGIVHADASDSGAFTAWTLPTRDALSLRGQDAGSSVASELSLTPCETDTSRLRKETLVDFFEPALSQDGAIYGGSGSATSAPPETAATFAFDALLIAEGEASTLTRHLGFDRRVTRFAPAVGIVVNLEYTPGATPGSAERKLPEHILGVSPDDGPVLARIVEQTGLELENLEYMRGSTHFVVATARIGSLRGAGIVREDRDKIRDLLAADNVDMVRLRDAARALASAVGIPETAKLTEKHGVHIFDFSCKGRSVQQVRPLCSADGATSALVLPVGDALQNPFWPQGLGVNRGFHSSLDAVWAAHQHTGPTSVDAVVDERRTAWRACDWLAFHTKCLADARTWTADPVSRYSPAIWRDMERHAASTGAEADAIPSTILARRAW